jgi:trans-aconitate methyltransferase
VTGNTWDAAAYDEEFGFVTSYGDDVLALLSPQPGERVLDLGCGTGKHAEQIARAGSIVVGVDADETMLAKARADHPGVAFVAADATAFSMADLLTDRPFDACFSNAALHWMQPQDAALRNVRSVLVPAGRFVAEMGGAGNIAALDASLHAALRDVRVPDVPIVDNYFPTIGEQAGRLEAAGFRVEYMAWFRRPTPLDAETTAADWTRHFRAPTWTAVPASQHDQLAEAVNRHAMDRGLLTSTGWIADYCRLRFVAVAQ